MEQALTLSNSSRRDRGRKAALAAGVVAAHVAVFAVASLRDPAPILPDPPVLDLTLFTPPQPAPPPPEAEPARESGGGAPAAPSRLRPPEPPPRPVERELPAPVAQAPEPALTVGIAPTADPEPGFGQGGEGAGRGSGVGAGDGPGAGVRTPPRNLRQPAMIELRRYHPPDALRRNVSGLAVVSCRIRVDTRLEDCRVLEESPAGEGFGAAGVRAAQDLYRFRPAMIDGRPDDELRAVIELAFGRGAPRSTRR